MRSMSLAPAKPSKGRKSGRSRKSTSPISTLRDLDDTFRKEAQSIKRIVRRKCPSDAVAEDAVAEAFEAATRAIEAGQTVTTGWIVTVARRRTTDFWRRKEAEQRALRLYAASADAGGNQADRASRWPDGCLEEAIELVPERQREALVLKYVAGYSVRDMAGRAGLTEHATESLLARGRQSLAHSYEQVTQTALAS